MRLIGLAIVPAMLALLAGCGAVTVAGVLASTASSTAVRAIDEQMQEQAALAPQRQQVAEANLNIAVEYMRNGQYEGALQKLDRARTAEPKNAFVYSVYGLVYQRIGDVEQAETNFRRSLDLGRDSSEILNNYGQFLCAQGRGDEAEKLFLEAAKNPFYRTPEVAYINAGLCAQRAGDTGRATGFFNDALAANPAAPAALLALADVKFAAGDYTGAHKLYTRYLKSSPQTPRSLWLGIRIAEKIGDKDAASSYTMLLKNKYPDSPEAANLKGQVRS